MPFLNNTPHVPGPPRPIATKVSEDHGANMKRKFEEMTGIAPPTKRVFDGSFRVAPSVPIPDNAPTETLFVPDHMVGLLIGAGGQHIMTLQNETSTKIEVAPNSYGKPRAVTITGVQENIAEVRNRIQGLIDQHGGDAEDSDVVTIDVVIPAAKAGLIIGTGGSTIKQLMGESNAKMYLIQETNQNNGIDKPLKITGSKDAVQKAKQLVLDLINQGSGGAPPYIEITVPKAAVGLIIGNGGNTIKKMQEDFNVRIQFKPDIPNQDPSTKICQILGDPDNYQNCAQKILEMISSMEVRKDGFHGDNGSADNFTAQYSAPMSNEQTVVQMSVPAAKAGLVIGKNGEVIRLLKMQSGANIELDRHAKANSSSERIRIFKIAGTQYQTAKAQHLIKQIVGEVPKHQRFMTQQEFMQQGGGGGGGGMMGSQMMQQNQMGGMPFMMGNSGNMDPMQMQQMAAMAAYSGGAPGAMMQPNSAGSPGATGWMAGSSGGMPGQNMMMPGASGPSGNPYEQWTQWMQNLQKQTAGQPDYMNQYMDYMKKYMEQMSQQTGQNYSKEQIDMWMTYMKSMMGGAGGSAASASGGSQGGSSQGSNPNWSMQGASGGMQGGDNPMEQWQRFYQQMQQQ